jgi:ribonuclease G
VKSEETVAIEAERRLRELVTEAGSDGAEAYLVRMNPRVSAYFTADGARTLAALEDETGHYFSFTGSEGLPLDHFAVVAEGPRSEIEEQSVPFREGEEVHVDIVEPHMYSEDDAVAKVDGYLIEVTDAIGYVGEKVLVRIEEAGRTSARAVLAELAEEAAAAAAERRMARERSATRAASTARARKKPAPRKPATPEDEAVEALADEHGVHAGTGPAAIADADEDAAKPRGRRRSRRDVAEGERDEGAARPAGERQIPSPALDGAGDGDAPVAAADELDDAADSDGGDGAVQSKPRRRGRRGGRRRSRATAEPGAAEVSEASE